MKTDFARQEQTINLFERERSEFYQEFKVICGFVASLKKCAILQAITALNTPL